MTKPIGRLYWNGNSVSGYIVIGNYALKFAAQKQSSGTSWIYQSKQQIEQEKARVEEMIAEQQIEIKEFNAKHEVKEESINLDAKYDELHELACANL